MSFQFRLLLTAALLAALVTLCAAADKAQSPSQTTYVLTNDDGVQHNYVSFFSAGGTQAAPTLTYEKSVGTSSLGIGGGYFATPRIATLPDANTQCVYASNAGAGTISGLNIPTQTLAGQFSASDSDVGDAFGIGIALNASYLYAGYSGSNTIATFSVLPGCQLSFLEDTPAAGLNGGSLSGMALHGDILVVAYADGSIESFNVSNGLPVSNGDAQNSTGFISGGSNFPEGVDITSDGHFAIFGDSSINTVIEVSDISSGKLTTTRQYTISGQASSVLAARNAVGPGVNSGALRLSPDQSMIFMGNDDGGTVSAAFFDKTTGRVSGGCTSARLSGFYDPWAFVGSLTTRDNTGTGGVLYVAEYGFSGSYIGVLKISTNGGLCSLIESSGSEVSDLLSDGLLSITTYPPRSF